MSLWLDRKPPAEDARPCSACGEPYDWQLEHGALFGTCLGCGRSFRDELQAHYLELIDAHPDWSSDELARVARQDFNGWLLAALVAQYP
jgi:hypothetical protein